MRLPTRIGDVLDKVAGGVVDGVQAAAGGVTRGVTDAFQSTAKAVDDTVWGARNLAADAVRFGGNVTGLAAGFAGEVVLFGATGGIGYIVFGGLPLQLGQEFANSCSRFSASVRGDRPQFMGINHYREEDGMFTFGQYRVLAIVYDPFNTGKDAGGFVTLDERQIVNALETVLADDEERRAVYLAALVAMQDLKRRMDIPRDLPDLAVRREKVVAQASGSRAKSELGQP